MSWKNYEGIAKGQDKDKGKNKGKANERRSETANSKQGSGNGKGKGKSDCSKNSKEKKGKGNGPTDNPGQGNKYGLYKNKFGENFSQDHVVHKPTNYLYQGLTNVIHKEYGQSGSPYAEYYMGAEGQLVSRKMFGMHGLSNTSHDPNLKTTGGMLYYQYDGVRTVSETTDRCLWQNKIVADRK